LIARPYSRPDARALDSMRNFNVHRSILLDRDRIICVGPSGSPYGALVWRPTALLHELQFANPESTLRRRATDVLISYASAEALARPWPIRSACFMVDPTNSAMLRYVRSLPGSI